MNHRLTIAPWLVALFLVTSGCVGKPSLDSGQLPTATPERNRIILFIHGGGDSPETWALDAQERIKNQLPEPDRWAFMAVDWEKAASSNLSSARRGLLLGEQLGENLLGQSEHFVHVVLVAHSVGAFVSHAMCETLAAGDTDMVIHQIMLDPFGMRRISDRDYGQNHFGPCSHYAEAYINTDDNAPTTDTPMPGMFTIDVTSARPNDYNSDRYHWWPVDAWLRSIETSHDQHILGMQSILQVLEDHRKLEDLQPPGHVIEL
jgi:pimeloyl-ACP methyl ester carboxylesterase